jgi:hypothetical protein
VSDKERRVIELGKADYLGHGRNDCPVTIEIELRRISPEHPNGSVVKQTTDHREITTFTELSVCGTIWNQRRTDSYSGGQNLDTIAELFPNDHRVQRIKAIWEAWHLNGMTAGCDHQHDEWTCTNLRSGYDEQITGVEAHLRALRELPADEANVNEVLRVEADLRKLYKSKANAHPEPEVNGWPRIHELYGEHPYPRRGDQCHRCGRNRWDEPTDACPETGYRWGTAWLVRCLPPEIEAEIRQLGAVPPMQEELCEDSTTT